MDRRSEQAARMPRDGVLMGSLGILARTPAWLPGGLSQSTSQPAQVIAAQPMPPQTRGLLFPNFSPKRLGHTKNIQPWLLVGRG